MDPTAKATSPWPPRPLPLPVGVEQARFTLRPWQPADAQQLALAWADEQVRRWTNPPRPDPAQARLWIDGTETRRCEGRALDLVIDIDGAVGGEIGVSSFDGDRRAALVGYWVAQAHRGSGLAATALAVMAAWFHAELGGQALAAQCHPSNVASHVSAQRAGFHKLGTHDGHVVYVSRWPV